MPTKLVPRWAEICSFLAYAIFLDSPAQLLVELIFGGFVFIAQRYTRLRGTAAPDEGVDICYMLFYGLYNL